MEVSRTSPVFVSGNSNMQMKVGVEQRWNDSDKVTIEVLEKVLVLLHLFPPQII